MQPTIDHYGKDIGNHPLYKHGTILAILLLGKYIDGSLDPPFEAWTNDVAALAPSWYFSQLMTRDQYTTYQE